MARARCPLQAGADPSKAQGEARALKLLSEYRIPQGWTNTTRNDRKLYSRKWSRPGILQRGPLSKTRILQHGWLLQPIGRRQGAVPELLHKSGSGQVLLPRTVNINHLCNAITPRSIRAVAHASWQEKEGWQV